MLSVALLKPPVALLVDNDSFVVSTLKAIAEGVGYSVIAHTRFETARRELSSQPPSALVANARLEAFNGIHLAYLAKFADFSVRALIYAHPHDPWLACEVRRAGAFYERQHLLPSSLGVLLRAALPPTDRRDTLTACRRTTFRGGRRTSDRVNLHLP